MVNRVVNFTETNGPVFVYTCLACSGLPYNIGTMIIPLPMTTPFLVAVVLAVVLGPGSDMVGRSRIYLAAPPYLDAVGARLAGLQTYHIELKRDEVEVIFLKK